MRGHRQQILISGEADWCRKRASQLLDGRDALWISEDAPSSAATVSNAKAATLLGGETGWLVYDGHRGFSPDAFGAVSGLVRGGGGLILLLPAEDRRAASSRFLKRFFHCINLDGHWQHNPQHLDADPVPRASPDVVLTTDQQLAVDAVCRVATGHRRRPAVLVADRGRGKSAALGIAAARLIKQGQSRILVTAPRRDAVEALFSHAALDLEGAVVQRNSLSWQQGKIQYAAPDALLLNPPDTDLLLVDEAAGLPVSMLEALLNHYARIAFATTVHGYEGAGQGFAVRFREVLDKRCRQWRQVRMQIPVRWSEQDPLEQFVFKALLLDAEPAEITVAELTQLHVEHLDRDVLLGNEQQLRELFGLLVSAHYRTTPQDLLELLDSPDIGILVAHAQGHVAGVLLYASEGGLETGLALAISEGRRRVRGHLVPQVLAAQLGFATAAEQKVLRIMRIAVHAELRRRGIARKLLDALYTHAADRQADMLGASFGATPALLQFWQHNGFSPVRLGMRREASSGAHAVLMLRPLSGRGSVLQEQAAMRFRDNLLVQLAGPLRQLEASVAVALCRGLDLAPGALSRDVVQQLQAFSAGQRGYEDCLGALRQLLLQMLASGVPGMDARQLQALLQKILQGRSWTAVAGQLQLTGKAEVLEMLRTAVRQALKT